MTNPNIQLRFYYSAKYNNVLYLTQLAILFTNRTDLLQVCEEDGHIFSQCMLNKLKRIKRKNNNHEN